VETALVGRCVVQPTVFHKMVARSQKILPSHSYHHLCDMFISCFKSAAPKVNRLATKLVLSLLAQKSVTWLVRPRTFQKLMLRRNQKKPMTSLRQRSGKQVSHPRINKVRPCQQSTPIPMIQDIADSSLARISVNTPRLMLAISSVNNMNAFVSSSPFFFLPAAD